MERNDDPKSGKAGAAALDLEIEELEPIVAPSGRVILNSNETLVTDAEELEVEVEELEPIVAPSGKVVFNSNETLLADLEQDDNRFESSLR